MNTLIKQCKEENRGAQRRLYELYANTVYRVCLRYMENEMEAEDCVSESFVKIFRSIKFADFKNEKMLIGWIRKIAVNECLMLLRKKAKYMDITFDEPATVDENQDFLSGIEAKYLLEIIQSLPVGYRTVFNLYAIEGFSHQEIAERLEISVGTSKSQLNRAKALLKEKLETWRNDG